MSKHKRAFRKKDGTVPKNPSRRKFVNQAFTLSMGAALHTVARGCGQAMATGGRRPMVRGRDLCEGGREVAIRVSGG